VEKEPSVLEEGIKVRTCLHDPTHIETEQLPRLADLSAFEEKLGALPDEAQLLKQYSEATGQAVSAARAMLKSAKDEHWNVTQEDKLEKLSGLVEASQTAVRDDLCPGIYEMLKKLEGADHPLYEKETLLAVNNALQACVNLRTQTADELKMSLAKAVDAIKAVEAEERNAAIARVVAQQIRDLGSNLAAEDESRIKKILEAYNALTPQQRKWVGTALTEKLRAAESAVKTVKAQAAFALNVQANAKNVPIRLKKTNRKIKAVSLAEGDALQEAVSSNPKAVKVSLQGNTILLKGLKNKGRATITVKTQQGAECSFTVKVQKGRVKAKKITAAATKITLSVGETFDLEAKVRPVTASGVFRYTSSDRKVAAVSGKGIVTAKKKGNARIIIKIGVKKKTVRVTVK